MRNLLTQRLCTVYAFTLGLFCCLATSVTAQPYLEPDSSVFAGIGSYLLKARRLFSSAFTPRVALRMLALPSFRNEYVVGVEINENHANVILLEASSPIWSAETLEMYTKQIERAAARGEKDPLEVSDSYLELKEHTPKDYREIKTVRHAQALPIEIANRIGNIWEMMLIDVRPPEPKAFIDLDGVAYQFSAFIRERGEVSGSIHSPIPGTKTAQLTTLAIILADFARGTASMPALMSAITKMEKFPVGSDESVPNE